jgi:hypothetical protein
MRFLKPFYICVFCNDQLAQYISINIKYLNTNNVEMEFRKHNLYLKP